MEIYHWNKNGFIILGCSGCEKTDFLPISTRREAPKDQLTAEMETCVLRRANTCIRWTLVWRWDWMVVYGNFYANFASHLTNFFPPRRGSGWGRGHVDWKFNARGTTCLYEFIRNVNLLWLSATASFPPTADRLSGRIVLWGRVEKNSNYFNQRCLLRAQRERMCHVYFRMRVYGDKSIFFQVTGRERHHFLMEPSLCTSHSKWIFFYRSGSCCRVFLCPSRDEKLCDAYFFYDCKNIYRHFYSCLWMAPIFHHGNSHNTFLLSFIVRWWKPVREERQQRKRLIFDDFLTWLGCAFYYGAVSGGEGGVARGEKREAHYGTVECILFLMAFVWCENIFSNNEAALDNESGGGFHVIINPRLAIKPRTKKLYHHNEKTKMTKRRNNFFPLPCDVVCSNEI